MVLVHARSESKRRVHGSPCCADPVLPWQLSKSVGAHRFGIMRRSRSGRLHWLWSGRFTRRYHSGLLCHSSGKFNSHRRIEGERELARHAVIEHGNNEAPLGVGRDQSLVGNGDSHSVGCLCAVSLLPANNSGCGCGCGCGGRGRGYDCGGLQLLKTRSWQGNGDLS